MATNLALDERLLEKALKIGGFATKKATVSEALREFIDRREQRTILNFFGKVDWDAKYDYQRARKQR
jgi:Arc/MetJ family transcription regulator